MRVVGFLTRGKILVWGKTWNLAGSHRDCEYRHSRDRYFKNVVTRPLQRARCENARATLLKFRMPELCTLPNEIRDSKLRSRPSPPSLSLSLSLSAYFFRSIQENTEKPRQYEQYIIFNILTFVQAQRGYSMLFVAGESRRNNQI